MTDFRLLQLKNAVRLAREWFPRSDSIGEAVHEICDGLEVLMRENAVLRERVKSRD